MTLQTLQITSEIDIDALKEAIEAVEENNEINGGSWSNWKNAENVAGTYEIKVCAEGLRVIQRAIESDGKSLLDDKPAVELAAWGQNFGGGFWDTDEEREDAENRELFAANSAQHGTVNFDGREYALCQQAHIDDDGSYCASAIDKNGKTYKVTWETIEYDAGEMAGDESDACDWDSPSNVVAL